MRRSCKLIGIFLSLALTACAGIPDTQRFKTDFAAAVKAYEVGDYVAARRLWQPLADNYDLAALRNLGHLYRLGQGVAENPDKAGYYYEKAARLGHAPSQTNLAQLYLSNDGLGYDNDKAMYWLKKAAAQDYPPAVQLLAMRETRYQFHTP